MQETKQLEQNKHHLVTREQVLMQGVAAQAHYLHDSASIYYMQEQHQDAVSAAAAGPSSSTDDAGSISDGTRTMHCSASGLQRSASGGSDSSKPELIESLMKDLAIYQALQMLGSVAQPEQYTNRCMKAAVTPENLGMIRTATVDDIAERYGRLVMRTSYVMAATNPAAVQLLSDDVGTMVDKMAQLHMLMSVAARHLVLEMCTINVETKQPETPPEGHWQMVALEQQLRPLQAQQLRIGFQHYSNKRAQLIQSQLRPIGEQLQKLINPQAAGAAATAAGEGAAMDVEVPQQQQRRQQLQPCAPIRPADAWSSSSSSYSMSHGSDSQVHQTLEKLDLAAGTDAIENAEAVSQLLQKEEEVLMQCKLAARTLIFLWLNTLDKWQLARVSVCAWPFYPDPVAILQYV